MRSAYNLAGNLFEGESLFIYLFIYYHINY